MKVLKVAGIILLILVAGLAVAGYLNLRDRHPGYHADLKILANNPSVLKAGFAALKITPEVPDRWVDSNEDGKYNEQDGDYYIDGNNNGKFDQIWIAGFSNNKPANGVHDDLWARTMILDDGNARLAIVVLDAIGFMHDDVVEVRKMLPEEWGLSYVLIAGTHVHEGPDMMGIWGKHPLKGGVDADYMKFVKDQIVKSVGTAVREMVPAKLEVSEDLKGAVDQVKDTRQPEVFDSGLRFIKVVGIESGQTLGSLLSWGNHPETLWSRNLLVSSDFPHFFREGVEKGVFSADSLMKEGIGGVAIFANGAVGGLMCTHPTHAVTDPFTGELFSEPTFEKAAAQGKQLSLLALNAMENPIETIEEAEISILVRTIELPIDNNIFRLAASMGILNRGTTGWMKMRTELAAINIGPISLIAVPGEIYPEIVNGGVEAPEGADFGIAPVEVPPLRESMKGKYKFVIGLANDEIGYIIPKSQWDVKPPFTYGREKAPYGEENSLGPETAPIIHAELTKLIRELNAHSSLVVEEM